MRELAKSMLRLSWSLSLFGVEQVSCLLRPSVGLDRAAAAFDSVTRSTAEQLGPATRATFQAGDGLQRGMVDLVFNLLTPRAWSRDGMATVLAQATSEVGAAGPQREPPAAGWGPIPGAGRR